MSLLRAQEDMAFNKVFNSALNITNLALLDAPLRNGYVLQPGPFVENELTLVEEIKSYLVANVEGLLLCPLGIGNHIDHAICREAVLELYKKFDVLFYEDLPYAYRITPKEIELHVRKLEDKLDVKLMSQVDGLQNCTIDKEQVIRLYKSQMNDEICSEIISYMNLLTGERLWGEPRVMEQLGNALNC
nr:hypothetical protein [Pontibacter ummariensis]